MGACVLTHDLLFLADGQVLGAGTMAVKYSANNLLTDLSGIGHSFLE